MRPERLLLTGVFTTLLLVALDAGAACVCRCVNGDMKAICESSIDLPPICPPKVCPIVPSSVAPIQTPRVPPIGTKECRQQQVLNPNTNRYEWREICK